jgi:hypothetical protein
MQRFLDPYGLTVGLGLLVQLVLFLRWLYGRIRNDELMRVFVRDMAVNHLPHIYQAQRKLCEKLRIELPPDPPILWIDLNGRSGR